MTEKQADVGSIFDSAVAIDSLEQRRMEPGRQIDSIDMGALKELGYADGD